MGNADGGRNRAADHNENGSPDHQAGAFAGSANSRVHISHTRKRHFEMDDNGHFALAAGMLKQILMRIKIALDSPPYNFVLHSAPFQGDHSLYFHWHIEVMPKITKMAGFEQGTGFYINPIPPEEAAETLRSIRVPREE